MAVTPTYIGPGLPAVEVIKQATGTGLIWSLIFTPTRGTIGSGVFQMIPVGEVLTCTINLEISLTPNSSTWDVLGSWDAVANNVTVMPLVLNGAHRLNITGFSGTGHVDIFAAVTAAVSIEASGLDADSGGGGTVADGASVTISGGGNAATVSGLGALKVDGSSVIQPVENSYEGTIGSPIPGSAILMGGKDPNGNLAPLKLDANGGLLLSNVDAGTFP